MKKNTIFALALMCLCAVALTACSRSSALTGSSSWPGISAEDDIVYAANGSFVEAVQDGQKIWSYPESANNRLSFYAAPAVDDTYVYAGTYSNQLQIINKEDGSLAASVEVGNNKNKIIASPLTADGSVIVVSSGGMVSSYPTTISGDTVTPNWQTSLSGEIWVKPVYFDGTLYIASMDKKMNLLDAASGELKQSISISGAVMSDPVLADGKLYFSTLANEVDEMDIANGSIKSLLTTEGEIWASPLLMGSKLIAADMNGIVYCIDPASGSVEWKTEKITAEKIGFIASPVKLDEGSFLLIDEAGVISIYSLDGNPVDDQALAQSVFTAPVVLANGDFAVLPVSQDGQIKTFTPDLKKGWTYSRNTDSKEGK